MSLIEKALEKSRMSRPGSPPVSLSPAAAPVPAPLQRVDRAKSIRLDAEHLGAMGIIPPPDVQRRHMAQIRSIKNKLLRAVRESGRARDRIILVTSALSGDGKTFVTINLALSMAAEKDYSVLLVDGDIPKPNVGVLLGIAEQEGLMDAARDSGRDPESLIIGTDVPGFELLAAGRGGIDGTEVVSSARMANVLDQLVSVPNRIVLVDSPPLLLTTEAAVLAQRAGQVLLVVREAVTPERAVIDAIEMLGERPGVGLVLNGVTDSRLEQYYSGYGHAYAYGSMHPTD